MGIGENAWIQLVIRRTSRLPQNKRVVGARAKDNMGNEGGGAPKYDGFSIVFLQIVSKLQVFRGDARVKLGLGCGIFKRHTIL